jgi:nicotinamide-nucleotide amidase
LYQLLQSVLENKYHGLEQGESIYQEGKCSIYLVGADESGLTYVKSACVPFLAKKYAGRLEKIVLRSVGASEEHVERLLTAAKSISGSQLAYTHQRRYDEDVIQMLYNANTPKMLADDVLRLFADGLNDSLYAVEDVKLEEQLVRLLKLRGKKISIAESFTGGGVGKRIVSVSGASEVYFEGLNTYNEYSKIKRLGVREYTLKSYGAVSDSTVYEMAAGLITAGDVDISIATTGIAGPKSDNTNTPVGLSFIAIGTKEKVYVFRFRFDGNRKEITEKAINHALFLAYRELKNM